MSRKWRVVWPAVLVAVVAAGRGWWRVTHTSTPVVTNWSLATGEDDVPMVSRHEEHLAAVLSGKAGEQVYVDGRIYSVAGRVVHLSLVSGGRHAVWTVERDGRRQGVLDGRATAREVTGRAVVTSAGELAWQRVNRAGRWLVAGTREFGPYARLDYLCPGRLHDAGREWHFDCQEPVAPALWRGHGRRGQYLVDGGRSYGPFERVGSPMWSEDGRHWGCVVTDRGRQAVLYDGRLMGWHEAIVGVDPADACCCTGPDPVRYSADGQHVLWQSLDGSRGRLWIDDRAIDLGRREQHALPAKLTGDSRHVLWGRPTWEEDGRWWVDGRRLSAEGDVTEEVIVGPGSQWAAVVGRPGRAFVATHLGSSGPFEQVTQPAISSATGQVVWAGRRAGTWQVWLDGRPCAVLPDPDPPRFGPESGLWYCRVRAGGREALCVNGRLGPWLDEVDERPLFSPDGQHMTHGGRQGEQRVVVLDGRVVARGARVRRRGFTPDGRRLLAVCDTGGLRVPWLAGAPLPPPDDEGKEPWMMPVDMTRVSFSQDGRHWAYVDGGHGQVAVVRDGQRSPTFADSRAVSLSGDGRHCVSVVRPGQKSSWRLLVDGVLLGLDLDEGATGMFGPDGAHRVVSGYQLIEVRWR